MAFLKLLFSGLLLLIAFISSNANLEDWIESRNDSRLQNLHDILKKYGAIHYNIILDLNIDEEEFYGSTKITIIVHRSTQYIMLHKVRLYITNIILSYMPIVRSDIDDELNLPLSIVESVKDTDLIALNLRKIRCNTCRPFSNGLLPPGIYNLTINYLGTITNNPGFFATTYKNKNGEETLLITTNFYPNQARYVFPCWDSPETTATFDMSIISPSKYMVFSNMPIRQTSFSYDVTLHNFHITPEIPPYLVAVAIVSNFHKCYNIGTDISIHCREELHDDITLLFVNNNFEEVMLYLKRQHWHWNEEIPKVDYIAVPNYWHNMHYSGIGFIREKDFFYDPGTKQNNMMNFISRAVGHQIVDFFIKPYWSYWLREGLIVFLGSYIIEQIDPTSRMVDLLVVQTQHESFRWENSSLMDSFTLVAINDTDRFLPISYYIKGPIITRMLLQILSTNVFFSTIEKYKIEKISTANKFWYYMNFAFLRVPCHTYRLIDIINTWALQRHYPVLNMVRDYTNNSMTIMANYQKQNEWFYADKWYIPFTYVTQNNRNFTEDWDCNNVFWLTPHKQFIIISTIPGPAWIILNPRQIGYYRVNYDLLSWTNIIDFLNSENYYKIHALNRAQFIDDSFHLIIKKKTPSFLFWKLTKYLWRETDYIAWYPMFKILEYMSSILIFNSDQKFSNIKDNMKNIFYLLFENNLKYEELYTTEEVIFTRYLRLEAIKWACIFETPTCLSNATHLLKAYIANSRTEKRHIYAHRYSAEWLEWIYCKGLMEADQETWNDVTKNYPGIHEKKISEYLICSNNASIIINNLASYELNTTLFLSIIAKHAQKDVILKYILEHIFEIDSRYVKITLLSIIINHIHTTQQYEEIKNFVKNSGATNEILDYILMKINLRQSQLKRIYQKYTIYQVPIKK